MHAWQSIDFQSHWDCSIGFMKISILFPAAQGKFSTTNIRIPSQTLNRKSSKAKRSRGIVKFLALSFQSFTTGGKAEEDNLWLPDGALPEVKQLNGTMMILVHFTAGQAQFSAAKIRLKQRSYLVLFAASFQLQRVLPSTGSTNKQQTL